MTSRPPGFLYGKAAGTKIKRTTAPSSTPSSSIQARGRVSRQQLYCEQVPLRQLAERFGTPLYVYSAAALRQRYQALDKAFGKRAHTICYSVKANSNLAILAMLAKLGAGFDVVSGGELARVQRAAPQAIRKTVFSGVGKTAEEMDAALRAGILMFNLESEGELLLLAERAAKLKRRARVALRVNPDVPAETHPYISTGMRQHKFGVPINDAFHLYGVAARKTSLEVRGISMHIGSQITRLETFEQAMAALNQLIGDLEIAGHSIDYVDVGGGLGINYEHGRGDEDFAAVAARYGEIIRRRCARAHLLLEPGRFIAGPAGVLLTRVLYVKQNAGKRFAVVDAAMNDLLRPALYSAYHEIVPVELRRADAATETLDIVDIVGPICETGDFLARDRQMPKLQQGELLAVLDAGAYGMSLASNYNSRRRPAEVLVNGSKARLIRRRETVKDMLEGESAN
jgi:diaminopimelate decarboxylase